MDALFTLLANQGRIYHNNNYTFTIPEAVKISANNLIEEASIFTEFFDECCDLAKPTASEKESFGFASASELYVEYRQFYNGKPPLSNQTVFGREIGKFITKKRVRAGIRLRSQQPIQISNVVSEKPNPIISTAPLGVAAVAPIVNALTLEILGYPSNIQPIKVLDEITL